MPGTTTGAPTAPARRIRLARSLWPADTSVAVVECTVGRLLRDTAAELPDGVALVDGVAGADRQRWTYGQLLGEAQAVAGALLDHLEPGERLGVWAPNVPRWQVLQFGAALAGITLVTLNPAYTAAEARYALGQSRCAAAVAAGDVRGRNLHQVIESLRGELPALRHVLEFGPGAPLWSGGAGGALPEVDPGAPAMIQYTSGTTGFPKGAILTHRGMVNNARLFARRFGIAPGSVWLNPLPMFHVGGCGFGALGSMWNRSAHVITAFDPGLALELIEAERAAFFPGVPTMLISMMEHARFARTDLSSLRVVMSGGTTVPPDLVRRVETAFGARFGAIFGQTEMSGVMCQSLPDDTLDDKTARVGRPLEQTEMKVVSPSDGSIVACGEIGEFHVRGIGQFSGYFDRPEETGDALDEQGWFHTGDLGTMDDRGYVAVTGRLKDMIIRGGENIYPREIEDLLHAVPGIAEVAVVGVPDDYWGEQVVAVVRPVPGVEADPTGWQAEVRARLSGQKVPRRWYLTESMPLTAGGKIQKFRLVAQIAEGALTEIGGDRG